LLEWRRIGAGALHPLAGTVIPSTMTNQTGSRNVTTIPRRTSVWSEFETLNMACDIFEKGFDLFFPMEDYLITLGIARRSRP